MTSEPLEQRLAAALQRVIWPHPISGATGAVDAVCSAHECACRADAEYDAEELLDAYDAAGGDAGAAARAAVVTHAIAWNEPERFGAREQIALSAACDALEVLVEAEAVCALEATTEEAKP